MNEGDASLSTGILIGIPALVVSILLVAVTAALTVRWGKRSDSYDANIAVWAGRALWGIAWLTLIIGLLAFYPWKAEYHQWVTKVGEVTKIDSRLASSSGVRQRFVVTLADGREFSCDDARCALVEPGDTLVLTCKRSWQFTGTDGYDCNYIERRTG